MLEAFVHREAVKRLTLDWFFKKLFGNYSYDEDKSEHLILLFFLFQCKEK